MAVTITRETFLVIRKEARALVPVDSDIDQLAIALEDLETRVGRIATRAGRRVSPTIAALLEQARQNLAVVGDAVIKACDDNDADKFGTA